MTTPRYYHITFAPVDGVDYKAVEAAIADMSLDWIRYTGNAYIVWTSASAVMLAGSLMTIRGLGQGYFTVLKIDLKGADFDGYCSLPQWAWEWINRERTSPPPGTTLASIQALMLNPPK